MGRMKIFGVGRMEGFRTLSVIFPPASMLDWALFGDEGIKDLIVDAPHKGKGIWDLLNLECSINYDVKAA
jgi:hypothetical protein